MSYLKTNWKKVSIIILLLVISFILSMKSGFNFFLRGGHNAIDGDVFRCIGWLMTKGYVPYRDIFDHKGPFFYFIQYIATFFGRVQGIWPFEFVFLTGSVVVAYLFARKFNNRLLSLFVVLLTFGWWDIYGTGDYTEEFSVLFQLIAIYYFVDFFLHTSDWSPEMYNFKDQKEIMPSIFQGHWFDHRVCIIGICFACTFFIKANCCAVWIIFCFAILIECIRNKYWYSLKRFMFSFWIGAFIITIPILLYLIINNAMADFIWDYFKFNGLYSAFSGTAKRRISAFLYFAKTPVWILAFIVMIFRVRERAESFKLDVIYMIFMPISVLLVTMAGHKFNHMGMAIIPSFIYPFSIFASLLNNYYKNTNGKLAAVMVTYLFITCIYPVWSNQIVKAAGDVNKYINAPGNRGMNNDKIVLYIKKNTKPSDKIAIFGTQCVYYLYSEREPASKYIFTLANPSIEKTFMEEYLQDLRNNRPKIIIMVDKHTGRNKWASDKMDTFLKEHEYQLVFNGKYPVYQCK